jgi:hypothetical protein
MFERRELLNAVTREIDRFPVTLLLGPRQCGKTTLAREIVRQREAHYFDLEDPECPLKGDNAGILLRDLTGLVVADEFQRLPSLFDLLRVLADRRPLPARFLILGSAGPELVKGASESLAGRVALFHMGGFHLGECGVNRWRELWVRGRFPDSLLAADDDASYAWRQNFIQTYLERDLPNLGFRIPPATLRRFWTMLAHWNGQTWNASELARAMDASQQSTRRYLDILTGSFLMRQLSPWFENLGKRMVKAPKIYFRDTGLLHALLGLRTVDQAVAHPRVGYSWEGFALEEILVRLKAEREAWFYRTHGGAELDLLLDRGGRRYGFELKFSDAPRTTRSMHSVCRDLRLDRLFVVCPGGARHPLAESIEVVPLGALDARLLD